MPNITRGQRLGGLLVYLVGPGRANEHEEPHLVAGDSVVMAWHDDAELDRDAALVIGRELDGPRRAFGTEVAGGHVWHCSLSLREEEGVLSDERWAHIAEQLVEGMGFTGGDEGAACRWVAVRHGPSTKGNDHIHVVVSLVREDGGKASVWNDRPRVQALCGDLEERHGLEVVVSRQRERGERGVTGAEQRKAQRLGEPEPERYTLARTVRACAAASTDEGEFVRRMRRAGLRVRPRYAAGRDDVVAGFSVAHPPTRGGAVVWFGGGRLARDLSLPRLRAQWPDTPEGASGAVGEWQAAKRGQRPVTAGREMAEPAPELWERCAREVAQLRADLRAVPAGDHAAWAQVAHETAGAFAAWSLQVEGATPGPLAETSRALAGSAQLRARAVRPKASRGPSVRGTAMLLASVAHGGQGPVAQAVLLRQLVQTTKALYDAHVASSDARRASAIADAVRDQLAQVTAVLPPVTAAAEREVLGVRDPGKPVPAATAATAAGRPSVPRGTVKEGVER